jgi:Glycosyl transferase family 2
VTRIQSLARWSLAVVLFRQQTASRHLPALHRPTEWPYRHPAYEDHAAQIADVCVQNPQAQSDGSIFETVRITNHRGVSFYLLPHSMAKVFFKQDYANKEMVILDDVNDSVLDLVPNDPQIGYERLDRHVLLGAKRNACIERSRGDLIAHWDDDDWYASWRLSYQVDELLRGFCDISVGKADRVGSLRCCPARGAADAC